MRAFLHFGYGIENAPRLTLEARVMVRHGVIYLEHEKRLYRLREWPNAGKHVYIQGERVRVSLVED